jgi:RNA polymerase sigma factor (sigma-70 family)
MADARTVILSRLLDANDPSPREAAWTDFVGAYSKLILHVARSVAGDRDRAMDLYTYILDQLRCDDFRRLRRYVADGRSEFATWLVVVSQRLCRDHNRQRYGRLRVDGTNFTKAENEYASRRRLVDLIGAEVDLTLVPDQRNNDAEYSIREGEVHQALERALESLEPGERLLLKLRFEDDCGMEEIAETLRFPSRFHARRQLTHVLDALKRALERRGIGESTP